VRAVTQAELISWGDESIAQINSEHKLSDGLYNNALGEGGTGFAWANGITLGAVVAAARVDASYVTEAMAFADRVHNRFLCDSGGYAGYNASVGNCGDRYTDDTAWIALAELELFEITADAVYLDRAKQVMEFVMAYENGAGDIPAGGIRWHETSTCGSRRCSSGPACLANLHIYQLTGEDVYLENGLRLYDWARDYGLQHPKIGLYYEGVHCDGTIDYGRLGYDTAPTLQAAVRLYDITGSADYLTEAQHMAYAMETHYVRAYDHAMNQSGKWCGHDMTNALVDLYEADGDKHWLDVAAGYLTYLHDNCRTLGRYPTNWADTTGSTSNETLDQASVARAFWTLARTQGGEAPDYAAILYNDCNYGGFSCGLEQGDYPLDELRFRGVDNNQISSVRLVSGYRATLYDNYNFGGSEITVYSSNSCLSWNDMTSSVSVWGNCMPSDITIRVSVGAEPLAAETRKTVLAGESITLSPPAGAGTWSWSGPNGFAANSREITLTRIMPADAGNYAVTFTNSCGASSTKFFALTVSSAKPRTNLAIGAYVSADSQITGEGAAGAIDGILRNNSKWCANTHDSTPHWLKLDLKSEREIDTFIVAHAAAGGESGSMNTRDFRVQKSNDGFSGWEDLVVVSGNTANVTRHAIKPIRARYLRLYVTRPTQTSDTAARIYEFGAYSPFLPSSMQADISGPRAMPDGRVDLMDVASLAENWLQEASADCPSGDMNNDCAVNWSDLDLLIDQWLLSESASQGE
jgi:hypothetical protein